MRTILFYVALILATSLVAQDYEPAPFNFNYTWKDSNGTYHNITNSPINTEHFKRNYPILFFQWGNPNELLLALQMNTQHGNRQAIPNLIVTKWEKKLL